MPELTYSPEVLEQLHGRATIPIWSATGPSLASVMGCSKATAYVYARSDDVPTIRLSPARIVVPVPALLALLLGEGS